MAKKKEGNSKNQKSYKASAKTSLKKSVSKEKPSVLSDLSSSSTTKEQNNTTKKVSDLSDKDKTDKTSKTNKTTRQQNKLVVVDKPLNTTKTDTTKELEKYFRAQTTNDRVLFLLSDRPLTNNELTEELDEKYATIQRATHRLKERDLIQQAQFNNSEVQWELTAKGRSKIEYDINTYLEANKFIATTEQIELVGNYKDDFKEFFEKTNGAGIMRSGPVLLPHVKIDFKQLSIFKPEMASEILDTPTEILQCAAAALKEIDTDDNIGTQHVTVELEAPDSQLIQINKIRVHNENKLIKTRCTLRNKTGVNPRIIKSIFECPACGTLLAVEQIEVIYKEPSRCSCGRKGKFNVIKNHEIDYQMMRIEELGEGDSMVTNPLTLPVVIKDGLTKADLQDSRQPGSKLEISGVLKSLHKLHGAKKTTDKTYFVEATRIKSLDDDFTEIKIDKKDLDKIEELSQGPNPIKAASMEIYDFIMGRDMAKEVILLQQFSGGYIERQGSKTRGEIHVLLIGDTGTAKTDMANHVEKFAPNCRVVQGTTTSGAGLTGTVTKDEITDQWQAEAGSLALANEGVAVVDELDKMSKEDLMRTHNALENGYIILNKANVYAKMRTKTRLLATANPKDDVISGDISARKEAEIILDNKTIPDRFDFIIPFQDTPDEEKDGKISVTMLDLKISDSSEKKHYLPYTKWIIKARSINPEIPSELAEKITSFYVNLRQQQDNIGFNVNPRTLRTIINCAKAYARSRLSKTMSLEDVQNSFDIYRSVNGVPLV